LLLQIVAESVRDDGTVLVYGLLSSLNVEVGISDLLFRGIKIHGFWMTQFVGQLSPDEFKELIGHTISMLSERVICPLIGEKFTLDQVKDAIKKSLVKQTNTRKHL
jgi:NADPH:quinone reductase-like Zn-dependent oxidoreductase